MTGTGKIVVRTTGAQPGSRLSDDGGTTWTDGAAPDPAPARTSISAQCVPGQAIRCYRVRQDRLGVDQSDDGGRTWQPSWPCACCSAASAPGCAGIRAGSRRRG
ncbi:hypothetical protein [Nonomuraea sp. NPDC052265]|uniref:hypothetical protein n=1 Tax=Nonomuraea sp. NPDC052265 TaxID=3364374 RepID=UPI0037C80A89